MNPIVDIFAIVLMKFLRNDGVDRGIDEGRLIGLDLIT